jgi:Tat protein translocase TatC
MVITLLLKEIQYRIATTVLSYCVTCFLCYTLSEEFLFLLALPLKHCNYSHFFISTHLTESFNISITSSCLLSVVFCMPLLLYQLGCFLLPSYTHSQRVCVFVWTQISLSVFVVSVLSIYLVVLPTIFLFFLQCNHTSTSLFVIQFQPKISDFIMLTLRFVGFSSIGCQIPICVLWLIDQQRISLHYCVKQRKALWFLTLVSAALIAPPDVWCQLLTSFVMAFLIEITLLYAYVRYHYVITHKIHTFT